MASRYDENTKARAVRLVRKHGVDVYRRAGVSFHVPLTPECEPTWTPHISLGSRFGPSLSVHRSLPRSNNSGYAMSGSSRSVQVLIDHLNVRPVI